MNENLKALDGLRGLAAMYVMVHHARLALTQSYQNGLAIHPEKYAWYDKGMFYFFSLFKFGHEAVIVFFVLSGFVIHLKQSTSGYNFSSFKILKYLEKRIVRIYPTLLVSFLLSVLLDYFFCLITGERLLHQLEKYHLRDFLFNFFLVPEAPIWGYNFPMWSLKHEWFFYIMYPLLLWLTQKHIVWPLAVIILLYLSYIAGLKIPYIGTAAYTLSVWSLGGFLAIVYKNYSAIKWAPYLLVTILIYPFINKTNQFYPLLDIVFGLTVTGAIAVMLNYKNSKLNILLTRFTWLGVFSYSIYLLHMPFLNLYQSLILHFQLDHALPYHLWFVVMSIMVTLPLIYIIYYFTERVAVNYKRKKLS